MRSIVGITALWPFERQLDRALAQLVGLLHVGLRRDVARRALQVVGHGPVELVAERLLDHVGHHRRGAAELRVAEGVARALLGEEGAVGVVAALGDDDGAVAVLLHQRVDAGEELLPRRTRSRGTGSRPGCRGPRPARRPRRSSRRGGPSPRARTPWSRSRAIERTSNEASSVGHRHVLGHRAEAGAAVGDGQVVVDRLRHVDRLQRVAHRLATAG